MSIIFKPKPGSTAENKFDFFSSHFLSSSTMNLISNLTAQQLRRAADIQDKIAALQDELSQYLGGSVSSAKAPRKRRMSAAGRARIIAAQKARWAKVKSSGGSAKPAKRRKMSAAAKAKIAAAARARWAKAKAAGRKAL
jgi:hypothetical protein